MDPEETKQIIEERPHRINPRIYVRVWAGLFLLTGITVSIAGRSLGPWNIFVVLLIATLKSGLVLNYFMHLKYENRLWLFRLMIPGIFTLIALFIGLTFLDVAFR